MKKKIAVICVLVFILSSFAQTVGAIDVILNSKTVKFPDQEPVIENWVTLVPIRPIAEALGLEIIWDDPTDTVTLKKDNFFIEMVIGSTTAKTSSGTKTLATPPCIINSRTMVPIRFIAEELGLTVSWNMDYLRVIIVGQVETQNIAPPPVEDATDVVDESEPSEDSSEVQNDVVTEPFEEETEVIPTGELITIDTPSSSITFEISDLFYGEDIELEDSFAFRSLDAFDIQHTYNLESAIRYESYANEEASSGILFIVAELAPYEGDEYDISQMNQELPEAPERPQRPHFPEIDWPLMQEEMSRVILEQVFIDMGVEIPEDLMSLQTEEVITILGMESEEQLTEQIQLSMENADLSQVPGYDEYLAYQEEYQIYNEEMEIYQEDFNIYIEEYNAIMAVKYYAARHFSSLSSQASDEEWATLFSSLLNGDPEVRYEGVEILDFEGKKVIHATVYAEDPDDEQGVYEYYYYLDGDCEVLIFGGSLFSGEASADVAEILSNMVVK